MKIRLFFFLIILPVYLFTQELSEQSSPISIESIEFQGNTKFQSFDLLKQIKSRSGDIFDNQILIDDRNRLIQFYEQTDMAFTSVSFPEKIPLNNHQIRIIYRIIEKETPHIQNLSFKGNNYLSEQKIRQFIYFKPNHYAIDEIEQIKQKVLDVYLNRAFLFCEVRFDSLVVMDSLLTACFYIKENSQVKFSNAVFRGNNLSKANSIIRISKLKKDKLIVPDLLTKAENNLNSKDYLNGCLVLPLNSETLLFDIKESKMTRLEGLISFNQSQKKSLIGYINFDFLNLFGSDRNLNFRWQSSQNIRKSIRMKYTDPGPSAVPLAYNLSFERDEVDSTYIKINSETEIYTYFDKHHTGLILGINDVNPGSRKLNRYEKNTQKNIGLFWSYNSLDYPTNPKSGMSLLYRHIIGFSNQDSEAIKRQSNEFSSSFLKSLSNILVAYSSLNARLIQNKTLNSYDLYSAGGTFSVRGFPEKFFNGNRILWLNNELRLLTDKDSRFFTFVDYAYIDDERPVVNKTFKMILGYGVGLRILTKAGILRMDYGLNYFQKKWTNPMEGYIHLGIETSF